MNHKKAQYKELHGDQKAGNHGMVNRMARAFACFNRGSRRRWKVHTLPLFIINKILQSKFGNTATALRMRRRNRTLATRFMYCIPERDFTFWGALHWERRLFTLIWNHHVSKRRWSSPARRGNPSFDVRAEFGTTLFNHGFMSTPSRRKFGLGAAYDTEVANAKEEIHSVLGEDFLSAGRPCAHCTTTISRQSRFWNPERPHLTL